MGSACEWMARTDARERIRAQSVKVIGPSVYLVRLLVTMGLRNVGTVIVVPAGCFSDAEVCNLVRVLLRIGGILWTPSRCPVVGQFELV